MGSGFLVLVLALVAGVPVVLFGALRQVNDHLLDAIDPLIATIERIDALVLDEATAERAYHASHDPQALVPYERAHAKLEQEWPRAEREAAEVGGRAPELVQKTEASTRAWEAEGVDLASPPERAAERFAQYRTDAGAFEEWLRSERSFETTQRDRLLSQARIVLWSLAVAGLLGVVALISIVDASRRWADRAEREKALNSEKDEFLSIAAHELKTPLAVIRAQAQSLLRRAAPGPPLDPARDEERVRTLRQLEVIDRQTLRLTRLIGELLDVSRLQIGRLELHSQEIDLAELATRVVEQVQAAEPRWYFAVDATRTLVDADAERLEQVLFNLLSNATKYSAPGTEVRVVVEARDGEAVCSVTDQGIGIPEADRAHLFDRYFRASNAGETRAKGMGLGLYVSQQIVLRHHGKLAVQSTPGAGSTFSFSLPLVDDVQSSRIVPSAPRESAGA